MAQISALQRGEIVRQICDIFLDLTRKSEFRLLMTYEAITLLENQISQDLVVVDQKIFNYLIQHQITTDKQFAEQLNMSIF